MVCRCANCGHLYTDLATIVEYEAYGQEYYEVTHRNWFNNPHLELFSAICKQVLSLLDHDQVDHQLSLLDVGCGKGQFLEFASDYLGPSFDLTGIDVCELPSESQTIHFDRCSLDEYMPKSKFDVVVSTLVVEHVPSPHDYFSKLIRLTRPGGLIVVVTNDVKTPLYTTSFFLRRFGFSKPFDRLFDPHHLNHFDREGLRRAAMDVGLQRLSSTGHSIPLRSLDIPAEGLIQELVFPAAVKALLELGRIVKHPFLQLQIFSVQ